MSLRIIPTSRDTTTLLYNLKTMKFKTVIEQLCRIKYLNRWVVFLIDLILAVFSTGVALLFINSAFGLSFNWEMVALVLFFSGICSAISIVGFRIYKGIIRHSNFIEAGRIGIASLTKIGLLFPALFLLGDVQDIGLLFVGSVADAFFTCFTLIVVRVTLILSYNYLQESVNHDNSKDKLLVLSTDTGTSSSYNSSLRNIEQSYRISGFLQLGKNDHLRMNGYSVYSVKSEADFDKLVKRLGIKAVLFPGYSSVKNEEKRLIRYCGKHKIRMLVLPSVDELEEGKINYRNLPEVRIEDLLGREEIHINMQEISLLIRDKVVMVTGAAGSIGSELCRQLCHLGVKQLVMYDSAETPMYNIRLELEENYPEVEFHPIIGDTRNPQRVESTLSRFAPQVVFHAAAYKHVPLMEENPCEAVCTNVLGTMIVADTAVRHGVEKFIMISTDKAVNPTNVMGASKRLAEIYVQSLGIAIANRQHKGKTHFITTRFGNVLGSNGSVIPRFREQLLKGGPVTVTHPDITRYFMTIPEACRLVLEAAFMGDGNDIFVFDMGDPVKIDNLARRMIELAGFEPGKDILIKYTGLRPGEKLYEELLAVKEGTLTTPNKKIFRAKVREHNYNIVSPKIISLCETARDVEIMKTVKQMKELVPEFISNHSKFELLDDLIA
jgi:FlaA1/EpsC-like NDP-sugar epimerase